MDHMAVITLLIKHIEQDRHIIGDVLRFAQTNPTCNQEELENISRLMISDYGMIKSELDEARKTLPDIPELRDLPTYDDDYIGNADDYIGISENSGTPRRGGRRRSTRRNRRSTRRNRSRKH